MTDIWLCVYTAIYLYTCQLMTLGIVCSFGYLWIVLVSIMNMCEQVFEYMFSVLLGIIPGNGIAESYDNSVCNFLRNAVQFSGFCRWLSGKESACQCRRQGRCGLTPWIGKIPWRRKWQPTPYSFFFFFFKDGYNFFLFFKLWKYDNTFTGDLENAAQSYI